MSVNGKLKWVMLTAMMSGRKVSKFLVISCLLFVAKSGFAQIDGGGSILNRLNAAYVKSIDEFILRFNEEAFHPDINYEEEENLRTRSLLSLVDWQRFQIEDSNVANLLISFVDSICWNDIRLHIDSGDIYAEAQCLFEYEHGEIPINLVFVYEHIRDNFYKWALAGANGLVENGIMDTRCKGYLNPIQHELHFSDLASACEYDLTRYISKNRTIDQLFYVLGMIKTGQLRFVSCNTVMFHFMQVPGFVFVVDKANRLSYNSGYLINSLIKIDESDKQDYIKQLTGIITK